MGKWMDGLMDVVTWLLVVTIHMMNRRMDGCFAVSYSHRQARDIYPP